MRGSISIKYRADDEMFDFSASCPYCSINIELYGTSDLFIELGGKLLEFPKSETDIVEFEHGQDRVTADYLYLKAFVFDRNGKSALSLVVNSAVGIPGPYRAEFGIIAEVAELNRLGQMLKGWDFEAKPTLKWQVPLV